MKNSDRDEQVVRAAIGDLRVADRGAAPTFRSIVTRPRVARPLPIGRLALAAALLLALGLGVTRLARRPHRFSVPSEVVALSSWRPMTEVLLDTPTRAFLVQTRAVDSTLSASRLPLPP